MCHYMLVFEAVGGASPRHQGCCAKGKDCRFSHGPEINKKRRPLTAGSQPFPCKFWKESGKVTRGDQCAFQHPGRQIAAPWHQTSRSPGRAVGSNRRDVFNIPSVGCFKNQNRFRTTYKESRVFVRDSGMHLFFEYRSLRANQPARLPDARPWYLLRVRTVSGTSPLCKINIANCIL